MVEKKAGMLDQSLAVEMAACLDTWLVETRVIRLVEQLVGSMAVLLVDKMDSRLGKKLGL